MTTSTKNKLATALAGLEAALAANQAEQGELAKWHHQREVTSREIETLEDAVDANPHLENSARLDSLKSTLANVNRKIEKLETEAAQRDGRDGQTSIEAAIESARGVWLAHMEPLLHVAAVEAEASLLRWFDEARAKVLATQTNSVSSLRAMVYQPLSTMCGTSEVRARILAEHITKILKGEKLVPVTVPKPTLPVSEDLEPAECAAA